MKAVICPECLSKDGIVRVCFGTEPCRRCGSVPAVALSRRELVACLKGREA